MEQQRLLSKMTSVHYPCLAIRIASTDSLKRQQEDVQKRLNGQCFGRPALLELAADLDWELRKRLKRRL